MKTIKVAIADDSELVRSRLAEKLHRLPGLELIWKAADGREALSKYHAQKPDILILDVQMPIMTGLEMLQTIKTDNKTKMVNKAETIFIVLTNYPVPVIKRKCMEAGADYFFDKTTEFDKVFEIINALINSYSSSGIKQL